MKTFVEKNISNHLLEWRDDYKTTGGRLLKDIITIPLLVVTSTAFAVELAVRVIFMVLLSPAIFVKPGEYWDCIVVPTFQTFGKVIMLPIAILGAIFIIPFSEKISPKGVLEKAQSDSHWGNEVETAAQAAYIEYLQPDPIRVFFSTQEELEAYALQMPSGALNNLH